MIKTYFTAKTFEFLLQLEANNDRQWFNEHKDNYELLVREPALDFIADMSRELPKISKHFYAIPKKTGGSLMRIQRDVRFSRNKLPYKTNIGIQFRHSLGKDVHAPGFYVHIEPENSFIGVGIWRPESSALKQIRNAIVDKEKSWLEASRNRRFKTHFTPNGESLQNAPRGFDKQHPLLEDLKRKDFIAVSPLTNEQVTSPRLKQLAVTRFMAGSAYMRFLCQALNLNY